MRQRRTHYAAAMVAASAALVACGTDPAPDGEDDLPTPALTTHSASATPAPDGVRGLGPDAAPPHWKAPFDDIPRTGGEMFVGLVFPDGDQADLSITGVAPDGSTRWAVHTNPACVGYGVTSVDGTAAAVVLASDADNREGKVATQTTANAYDVRDGTRLWGAAPVPGPMVGPGLIFGQATPSIVGGAQGERLMLAAHSGEPVQPPAEGAVPLYEHHGTGLFAHDDVITAVDTASGATLWHSDTLQAPSGFDEGPRHVTLLDAAMASTGDLVALRWTHSPDDDTGRTSLHELGSGRLIADLGDQPELRTTVDQTTNTAVVSGLDQYRTTKALDIRTGAELWRDDAGVGSPEITLAHDGVGYGTRAGRSVAVDILSGRLLGDGDWPVPVAAASDILLAPLPPRPGVTPSDRTAGSGPDYVAYEDR
ncbi:PQQ-binding-like beta-propeller repeat protein [Saccharomonospora azurea]|uniref:outer membrane protein assembly factor BamB family protein n=1 Tax=Saccharomonospora azurea TaxID=40988 RepID=UPI002409B2DA|nr:PQQ-binding-like beta-propeller repeat protein [Saccharomonospora azurea]